MQHNDSSPLSKFQPCMEFMRPGHMLRCNMFTKGSLRAVTAAMLILTAAAAAPRSNPASCREAANGLISLLDAGKDDGALYRDTYAVVVTTCGPASPIKRPTAPPSPVGRAQCSALAAAMVDLIEDDKMESAEFVRAREAFADACTPR
jgi:hypothetical protein